MKIETCEICEKQFIRGYGYCLMANWTTTGHHAVASFVCPINPSGQHFGCSPEHAIMAFMNCLQNHMSAKQLLARHKGTGKPRYLPEHEVWAKDLGEEFHIVKIVGGGHGNDTDKV